MSLQKVPKAARAAAGALALVMVVLFVAGCGSSSSSGDEVSLEWHPGGHEIRSNEIEAAKQFLSQYRN